ncbi:MAG: outer membrane beta-barrel protein [Zavarzinella sp.]
MLQGSLLGLMMTVGQAGEVAPPPVTIPAVPATQLRSMPVAPPSARPGRTVIDLEAPVNPVTVTGIPVSMQQPPMMPPVAPAPMMPSVPAAPMGTMPATLPEGTATAGNCETCEKEEEPEAKGHLMSFLEGTHIGNVLDEKRISISGWTQLSYTHSNRNGTALPVTWNDRPDVFQMQQTWLSLGRDVDTESGCSDWGFHVDAIFGTDYRFLLPRGFFNGQLQNANGNQNWYGFDAPQFYASYYTPDLFEGTEVRVGRMLTPFGYESVKGADSPFLSRSYAFNWAPPFSHMGIMFLPKFNDQWSGVFMLANGNDVFIDPSQEIRFVGALTWADETDSVTFGTSVGRGKFNAGRPFAPTTLGLMTEPAGRNNINVFDLLWTHAISDKMGYAFEVIYGYQTNVPANVPGGIIDPSVVSGTAHWYSFVNYLTYSFSDCLGGILRLEAFNDVKGQRTGFEGWYLSATAGVQVQLTDSIWLRPELRYDCNDYSNPFAGGRNNIFLAAADLIIRW